MNIKLTKEQFELILKEHQKDVDEQQSSSTPSPQPSAGTSSSQSGGQGYPEVSKWESGVTRGPGNQLGVTKWSDVVGSVLKRDKANQLK